MILLFDGAYPKLKRIIIDVLSVNNTVRNFAKDILNDHKFIDDCRTAPVLMSKIT